ncbi:MAG: tetratricopeptide repeat protein, partial [Methanothrix sp.]|nr:tetratricopeptide repeat protein [Methanothrix sp.]
KVSELRNRCPTVGFWAISALLLAALAASWATASAEETSVANSSESWRERGHDLFLSWRMEEALQAYEESLTIDPRNATAWLDKAIIHEILARQAHLEAVALFDEILAENPEDARAWWGRGVAEYGLERPEEARGSWERALEIYNESLISDPEDGEAWFEKAELLISLGRGEEAIDAYERAIEKNSTRADAAARTVANLLMEMGLLDESWGIGEPNP